MSTKVRIRVLAGFLVAALALTGCTDVERAELERRVTFLAADELNGRENNQPGGLAARDYLVDELRNRLPGAMPGQAGDEAYLQHFSVMKLGKEEVGANVVAKIEGSTRPDEYVIVSAHYDGQGTNCHITPDPTDTVCNSATDNATSVAIVLGLIDRILSSGTPDRSIIFAFFDAEEKYLVGSEYFVKNPIVPLANMKAIVNFDITGSRILPSLADNTFIIGAESGGSALSAAAEAAKSMTPLNARSISLAFGHQRSDHYWFSSRQIPSVFFPDVSDACYHSRGDDVDKVDFAKLKQEMHLAYGLLFQLVYDSPDIGLPIATPTWTVTPQIAYSDAVQMLDVINEMEPDWTRFNAANQARISSGQTALTTIVDEGPENFDAADMSTVASVSGDLVVMLSTDGVCQGFLDDAT